MQKFTESLLTDRAVLIISLALLSVGLPLGIFATKVFLKDSRAAIAKCLSYEFPALAETYTFLFAVAKYANLFDTEQNGQPKHSIANSLGRRSRWCKLKEALSELPSYLLPVLVYAAICFTGFYTAMVVAVVKPQSAAEYHFDNYLIYGMRVASERKVEPGTTLASPGSANPSSNAAGETKAASAPMDRYTDDEIIRYGRGTIAVSVAAFVGAYLWTLIFLARRVTNFDLSPFSFLRATIQICLACFVCVFLRHLYDSVSQLVWQTTATTGSPAATTSSWLLALAFLIGFYPALGLNYLQERFAFLRFKTRNTSADALARELPLDMVDGIDSYIKFRLGEYEIEDIENMALANPIQLFVETPYPLRKIVDWIGQAQLILEVDNAKITELRNLNIRTSLDLLRFGETEGGRKILMGLLHPMQTGSANDTSIITERLRTFEGKQHVRALREMIDIIAGNRPPADVTPLKEVTSH